MKAGELMTTGAARVRPDASLADAVRLMVENRISGLPVVDASDKLVGIISEGDFLRSEDGGEIPHVLGILTSDAAAAAGDLRSRRVADLMTRDPVTITAETPVEDIVALMNRHKVKRLPVVTEGKVVGIVSRANLLLALLRRFDSDGRAKRT
jgi:CBS domain-containing protein